MGIPADLKADVQRLFDAHNANPANAIVDPVLGGFIEGITSDATRFIALCLFGVQQHKLSFVQQARLNNGVGKLKGPMEVFGFASNTTNANWSHAQNRNLALDRLQETANEIIRDGVDSTFVTFNFGDSGELGPEDIEDPDERFSMVVATLLPGIDPGALVLGQTG
jgi:hypothetical protein